MLFRLFDGKKTELLKADIGFVYILYLAVHREDYNSSAVAVYRGTVIMILKNVKEEKKLCVWLMGR